VLALLLQFFQWLVIFAGDIMKILVTGATGYIGSHVCKVLFEQGHTVVGLDINFNQNDISKYCSDVINADVITLKRFDDFDAVVHLAGLIQVEESTKSPTKYYNTNLNGTINICNQFKDSHIIFASTAGAFDPVSPYAKSKVAAEDVIKELSNQYTIFRFFNVAGSDGVNKQFGPSTHLVRIAAECAVLKRNVMYIYGTDYETRDGTCIRDYIHVVDLANAIAIAVKNGPKNTPHECIGSGTGYTVNEVIDTMKQVSKVNFTVIPDDRRAGDVAILAIDNKFDGLTIQHNLEDICRSAYKAELI